MAWYPAPFIKHILLEANRRWPTRSRASDGIIGDATHTAQVSDHNPDPSGCVHAVDITHDPAHGFDAWREAQQIAVRIALGKDTRIKYLVSFDGYKDVIFNPSVSMTWRQNGTTPKREHASHLHVSIRYDFASETSRSDLFVAVPPTPVPEMVPPPNYVSKGDAMLTIWYLDYPHGFWIDKVGCLQHNYGVGLSENMTTKYKINERYDPVHGVSGIVNPKTLGLAVRAVTTTGRMNTWDFSPSAGWGVAGYAVVA